jgi:predicted O-linked N-acetylglucosamine transferase (SPINDLY family)
MDSLLLFSQSKVVARKCVSASQKTNIKVGYLRTNENEMKDIINAHDLSEFSIVCYQLTSSRTKVEDEVIDMSNLDHWSIAWRIADDHINVLVVHETSFSSSSDHVLRLRPAGLQIIVDYSDDQNLPSYIDCYSYVRVGDQYLITM